MSPTPTPLMTPRKLAEIVVTIAHEEGVEADAPLSAQAILAVLAASGQRAMVSAIGAGLGQAFRVAADAAARKVEGR